MSTATVQDTYYRPGMIFLSKAPGHIVIITRDNSYNIVGGVKEIDRPILYADFARGLETIAATLATDDGTPMRDMPVYGVQGYTQNGQMADMRGGAFDLDATALK